MCTENPGMQLHFWPQVNYSAPSHAVIVALNPFHDCWILARHHCLDMWHEGTGETWCWQLEGDQRTISAKMGRPGHQDKGQQAYGKSVPS